MLASGGEPVLASQIANASSTSTQQITAPPPQVDFYNPPPPAPSSANTSTFPPQQHAAPAKIPYAQPQQPAQETHLTPKQLRNLKIALVIVPLLVMWILVFVGLADDDIKQHGIVPRTGRGLGGLFIAWLIHSGFEHIANNSVGWLILGGMVMLRSLKEWIFVTLFVNFVGGFGVWVFGRSASHIGASGIIFGYWAYALVVGFIERPIRVVPLIGSILVGVLFTSMILGVVPSNAGVSWEGHLCGGLTGIAAAFLFRHYQKHKQQQRPSYDNTV